MKFALTVLTLLATIGVTNAVSLFNSDPKVEGSAAFPASNPFGQVVNGEKNKISVLVENKSDGEIIIKSVSGSFHHPESGKFIRNTTALSYNAELFTGSKVTIPYIVNSEAKPQDTRLRLFVDYTSSGVSYRLQAFDSVVSIVEPKGSLFDLELILTYLMIAGILGSVSYFTYQSYFPVSKKSAKAKSASIPTPSAPVGNVTATSGTGYSEEWIPEHHLKSRRSAKGDKATSAASSGEESAPEKKKGKGKGSKRA